MKKLLAIFTLFTALIMTTNAFAAVSVDEAIENGVLNCQEQIDVSMCNVTPEEVLDTFTNMFNTNPALSNLDGTIDCNYVGDVAVSITVGYLNNDVSAIDSQKAVNSAINNIISEAASRATDFEKAKYVHDYLIENSEYDYTYASYNIYDLLINGKGTCNSYSLTYKAAMDELGIDCTVVIESDNTHSWNQINVDGKWYNVDVTWDKNYSKSVTPDSTFFMKSDDYFKAMMHHSWKSSNVCDTDL